MILVRTSITATKASTNAVSAILVVTIATNTEIMVISEEKSWGML